MHLSDLKVPSAWDANISHRSFQDIVDGRGRCLLGDSHASLGVFPMTIRGIPVGDSNGFQSETVTLHRDRDKEEGEC